MPLTTAMCYQPIPRDVHDVATLLEDHYGRKQWHAHGSPLDELVATILSQHTSDTNTARAFQALKNRFDDWNAVRIAPTATVEEAIRPSGLAAIKAPRIQAILQEIHTERHELNLDHLRSMPLDDARRWLLDLHGVGPKTAACVLLFSLGQPALPVDTHVHRVSLRLGLIGSKVSAEAAHTVLEGALGPNLDDVYAFHLNAIAHGRSICRARVPRCERCFLHARCSYFHENTHDR